MITTNVIIVNGYLQQHCFVLQRTGSLYAFLSAFRLTNRPFCRRKLF